MTVNTIVCRYGELALKGGNRRHFERLQVKAIRRALVDLEGLVIDRERGRILLRRKGRAPFSDADLKLVRDRLSQLFGLVTFSPSFQIPSELADIERCSLELFAQAYAEAEASIPGSRPISFRVRIRRADKSFPMESVELGRYLADKIIPHYPRLTVDLSERAELTLAVELRERHSFIYSHRYSAPGGLPADSAEPGLALLSGGIDSPVACYLAMKRGVHLDFVTFHSHPYTPMDSVHKVARLVQRLNTFQRPGRYFACNMSEAQKIIRDQCTESYRTIFYRRLMMRIASAMTKRLRGQLLVTGEVIGQVASQTVPNLNAIDESAGPIVIRPLICMDKDETVAIARRIGTFDISAEPCADSCTVFAPDNPATGVKMYRVHEDEAALDMDAMVAQCLAATVEVDPESLAESPWRM